MGVSPKYFLWKRLNKSDTRTQHYLFITKALGSPGFLHLKHFLEPQISFLFLGFSVSLVKIISFLKGLQKWTVFVAFLTSLFEKCQFIVF